MSIPAEFDRAYRLHQQGKLREAFLRYDAVLAADPTNAPALHYSGVVLFQAGKIPEAAERIRASLKLEPASADAWSNLALVLESAGRREAAANALKEAAKLSPRSPEILANLAAAQFALGRVADAEASARGAIAVNAQHAAGWHNLALALEPQGRLLEAMDAASRATTLAPAEPAYAGFKAQLEITAGMRKKARATLDAALVRKPNSAALQFELAGLLERENELERAMQAYANVVRLEPTHGAALSQLLFLRQRLGDWHDLNALRQQFRDGVAQRLAAALAFRAAVAAVDPRRAAALRRGVDRESRAARRPALAHDAQQRAAAHRLPVRGLPHARDGVPRRGAVRAARSRALRGRRVFDGTRRPQPDARTPRARLRSLRRCGGLAGAASRDGDSQRRDRHPGRPQGTYAGRAAVGAGAASRTDPGALPGLSRHARRRTSSIT